jgi:hypothetical protein
MGDNAIGAAQAMRVVRVGEGCFAEATETEYAPMSSKCSVRRVETELPSWLCASALDCLDNGHDWQEVHERFARWTGQVDTYTWFERSGTSGARIAVLVGETQENEKTELDYCTDIWRNIRYAILRDPHGPNYVPPVVAAHK